PNWRKIAENRKNQPKNDHRLFSKTFRYVIHFLAPVGGMQKRRPRNKGSLWDKGEYDMGQSEQ
ncbi:MAG: hypothetical protein O3C59_11230, partial [Proteobacteria bacterium]|nr:hypothetical protein [Pseudomonadota bacterium]